MARFTLRQLEHFRAIARTGSISAAAAQEMVSRSAMASALGELEKALDAELVIRRKSQGIVLTEAGQEVLELASALLHRAEELEGAVHPEHLRGTLSVGCFSSLAPTFLPVMMDTFARAHPDVQFRAHAEPEDLLLKRLRAGEIDVAVSYNLHMDPTFHSAELYRTRMHVILAADDSLAHGPTVSAPALLPKRLILLDTPPSPQYVTAYFQGQGLTPHIGDTFSSFELIRSMVARGMGYSLFIQEPVGGLSYEGLPVVSRPLDPAPRAERVSIVWVAGRRPSAKVRAFVLAAKTAAPKFKPIDLY
ncbi:LysR substrate-binding domain-containing protein [Kocuria rosea]|uniref:LysR substrate-binding domain-containing protein n=1 Tax=Kocuria rosea TaxID=1275 RepID=UPI000F6BE90F|nr:LysR substrate-binding domain-containing protein [Kocuria rosea]VEI51288.1 HTH-type transcriptional regulator AbgR [Kocuria rosea]